MRSSWGNAKPPVGVGIDFGHPLARGLLAAYAFSEGAGGAAFDTLGRLALPLTPSVAVRGASASLFSRQNFNFTGVDPVTGAPLGLTPRGPVAYLNAETGEPHIASTVASKNLNPMYQDEYILGFQKQLTDNLSLGMRAIHRDLKAAIDDNCDYTAVMAAGGFTYG